MSGRVDPSAYRFMRDNSGYCVGSRAVGSIEMARSEAWLRGLVREGLARVVWGPDDAPDYSFVDTWTAKEQERWRKDEHTAEFCLVQIRCSACSQWETKAALHGIIDASDDYRRVIEAELAGEALHEARQELEECS